MWSRFIFLHTVYPWLLTPCEKNIFTWDKDIYSSLIVFFRFSLQFTLLGFIGTHVVPGVLYSCVVNEERRRVVPRVNEGVFRQRFNPNDVSFTGTAYVEDGTGLQDELLFVGHNGGRRQAAGNCKIVWRTLEELSKNEGKKTWIFGLLLYIYLKPAPPRYPQRRHTSLPHPWLWMFWPVKTEKRVI